MMVVRCKECGEEHTSDEVKSLNIEEDEMGRDIVTFECRVTNRITTSLVFQEEKYRV